MDKKTKNRIQDLAADILVAPLTAAAEGVEAFRKFSESDAGQKTIDTIRKTVHRESVEKTEEHN